MILKTIKDRLKLHHVNLSIVLLAVLFVLLLVLPFFFNTNACFCFGRFLSVLCRASKEPSYIPSLLSAIGALGAVFYTWNQDRKQKEKEIVDKVKKEKDEYYKIHSQVNALASYLFIVKGICEMEYIPTLTRINNEALDVANKISEDQPIGDFAILRQLDFLLEPDTLNDKLQIASDIKESQFVRELRSQLFYNLLQINSNARFFMKIIEHDNAMTKKLTKEYLIRVFTAKSKGETEPFNTDYVHNIINPIDDLLSKVVAPMSAISLYIFQNGYGDYESKVKSYKLDNNLGDNIAWHEPIFACFAKEIESERKKFNDFYLENKAK